MTTLAPSVCLYLLMQRAPTFKEMVEPGMGSSGSVTQLVLVTVPTRTCRPQLSVPARVQRTRTLWLSGQRCTTAPMRGGCRSLRRRLDKGEDMSAAPETIELNPSGAVMSVLNLTA